MVQEGLNASPQIELHEWNEMMLTRGPSTPDKQKYFNKLRDAVDPSRADLTAWSDLQDLEEGRTVPDETSRLTALRLVTNTSKKRRKIHSRSQMSTMLEVANCDLRTSSPEPSEHIYNLENQGARSCNGGERPGAPPCSQNRGRDGA